MAYDSYAPTTKAVPCQDRRAEARRGNAFWVVLGGGAPASPFTVLLPDGREALALFSSEEEARMFCHCGKEGADHLCVRETSTGEVLSLLFCPWCAKHVVLDPLPEVLGGGLPGLSELLALDRQSFARSFCGDQARGPKRSPSLQVKDFDAALEEHAGVQWRTSEKPVSRRSSETSPSTHSGEQGWDGCAGVHQLAKCVLDKAQALQGERRTKVWANRAKNVLAMLAIGNGVMQMVAPQEHERLWMVGPTWLNKAKGIGWLAENPRYTRVVGAAQLGGAVWFALGKYRSTGDTE